MPRSVQLDALPDRPGSNLAHLAHLLDYCRGLLGQDAEAASAARSALDSAYTGQHERDRLRPWLFAHARRHALLLRPPGSGEPAYMPRALIAESSQQLIVNGVARALRALTDRDREILDLVYRHGIWAAHLPEVLAIPADEAYRRLVNAEAEFISLAAGPKACPGGDLEDIAALPLATLPAAEDARESGHQTALQFECAAV